MSSTDTIAMPQQMIRKYLARRLGELFRYQDRYA